MGQILISIFFIAFVIRTVRNTLYQVFLWQIKEYRLDRMIVHLKTRQGRKMVFGLVSLAKFALIGGYLLGWPVFGLVVFVYLAEAIWEFRELRVFGWKRPVWTVKAVFVIVAVIGGEILGMSDLFFWSNWTNLLNNLAAGLLFLDKILAPTIGLFFLLLSLPTKLQRSMVIKQAKAIIFKHPNLITIGITGSYGKTSTKEFLAQILSSKFRVLKTKESQNTTIGVAKTIINGLTDQEVFVCEMGAYKIGEIRQICQICRPKIGIITGINEQHLDLFGSLEKTMEAKYELIEALPKDGLAVFNGDNKKCRELYEKTKKIDLISHISLIGKDVKVDEVKVLDDKLEFKVLRGLKFQEMTAQLLGKQNIENILAAIVVANHLGMSLEEISEAVKKLEPPEMTMKLVSGELGALVDDTFNANPDGVLAAIEYMKVYSGKKILVLTPMIELGNKAREAHQKVGKLAGEVCDLIILTNKNFYEDFIKGFGKSVEVGGKVWTGQGKEAVKRIKDLLDENGVAVFEGKESKRILEGLYNDDH